jgi:branched-chain amino acid transport system ATP-binding protein
MLEISGIDVFRNETQVLWDVSLTFKKGEKIAILGSNGAGKTTLLSTIMGLLPVSKGDIRFNGVSISGKKPHEITQMGLSIVPEGRHVYPQMSVLENLYMGGYPKRSRKEIASTLTWDFDLFPKLADRRDQMAGTLSGGEQQMLAIGRALMSKPEFLFIDELSLGLAPVITKEIFHTLEGIAKETTIVMVEQNVEQALKYSQYAYILENGRITQSGPSETLARDESIRKAYLGM